ncbi:MAG: YafY family transcriptional regulator [Anaerolineae bacterium]|nr:YafY family transcriptional regulator [Anaerolineae bacterium]
MYSPTTRLLTVLELLQSYKQMSGPEIARRLEIDVRTVRRYIVSLQDMGIPVEAERGPYGAYQLQRGQRLPPLMFSDAEAVAITLGLLAIRELRFPVDVAAVEGALAKTERVLPEKPLAQVRGLQEAITFNVGSHFAPPALQQSEFVVILSSAVQAGQRVHLSYRAWNGDVSERDFDPYGIVINEGYWYTVGYCHLRQSLRTFRLDRVTALELRDETFERPEDFDPLDHVLRSIGFVPETHYVEVLLKTTLEQAQAVIPPVLGTLEPTDEGVIFRRSVSQLKWVAHILVELDFPVVVRQPEALRAILRRMAAQALAMIDDPA